MRFVVFRSTAIATLVLLSQINPALLCTFKQLPPYAVKTVPKNANASLVKSNIGECMEMCYEYSSCVYVISYKGLCTVSPSGGETIRADAATDEYGNHGVVYHLDKNTTDAQCPWLEEWLEESR